LKTTVTRRAIECDGCEYLIGSGVQTITLMVRDEQFDFHDGGEGDAERHDCFRYWAHSPETMKRSLRNRGWGDERIDEFMSLMLYRADSWGPGIARPKKEAAAWIAKLGDNDGRQIARDEIGDVVVSTVWLGLNHSIGDGPPLIFETMIFGGEHDEYQERYSTVERAREGHRRAIELVTNQRRENHV